MRFPRFFRLPQIARPAGASAEASKDGLDAFRSETAPPPPTGGGKPRVALSLKQRPGSLVLVLAALVIVEAVPAGLWLYEVIGRSTFLRPAAAAAPTGFERASAALVATEPAVLPATPPASDGQMTVESKGADRKTPRPAAAGTSGVGETLAPGAVGGLISVSSPVAMRIFSRGRIVGTTEAETVMLPVGTHELTFVSDETGYKARRSVKVQAGRTTTVELDPPPATVHVNATPWAEVWIDNKRIGETPIGNLQLPIGTREFVFRHPDLGERRRSLLVTLKDTTRVSMDMRVQ